MDKAEFMSSIEAAKKLGYHVNHLYRLLKDGTLKGTKWGGRIWMIEQDEVERLKALQDENGRYWKGQR